MVSSLGRLQVGRLWPLRLRLAITFADYEIDPQARPVPAPAVWPGPPAPARAAGDGQGGAAKCDSGGEAAVGLSGARECAPSRRAARSGEPAAQPNNSASLLPGCP